MSSPPSAAAGAVAAVDRPAAARTSPGTTEARRPGSLRRPDLAGGARAASRVGSGDGLAQIPPRGRGRRCDVDDRCADAGSRRLPHDTATGAFRRMLATVAVSVGLVMSISGCAVAARLLAAAEAVSIVHDMVESDSGSTEDVFSATPVDGATTLRARVTGAGKSGLRLNSRPGSGRLTVLPEGAVVAVLCRMNGRRVDGPHGPNSQWSGVVTAAGHYGYMSDAFLDFMGDDTSVLPRCALG